MTHMAVWLQRLRSLYNAWSFYWRNRLHWQRAGYQDPIDSKENLYAHLEPSRINALEQREVELIEAYGLVDFRQTSSRIIYQENIYLVDMLDHLWHTLALPVRPNTTLCDIGCKNWYYVFALYYFLRQHGGAPALTGIELDGYRVYQDFYSRRDYAEAYIRSLTGCQYVVDDALNHHGQYDVVVLFFPFIIPEPLLQWGLPLHCLQPEQLLRKAWNLLKPQGILLIQNQGEQEPDVQYELFQHVGIQPLHRQLWHSDFFPYEESRTVWVCVKDAISVLL